MQSEDDVSVNLELDEKSVIAGDRIGGEVQIRSSILGCTVTFESLGIEKVVISGIKDTQITHKSIIYTFKRNLTNETQEADEVFPFSFKLPAFAPSSMSFDNTDHHEQRIKVEITYSIKASIKFENNLLKKTKANLTVHSARIRDESEKSQEASRPLNCCICFTRGAASMSIISTKNLDPLCNSRMINQVIIKSDSNKKLASIVGQYILEFSIKLPNQSIIKVRKALTRTVADIKQILSEQKNNQELIFNFELNKNDREFPKQTPTNDGVYFQSRYFLQVYAVYYIGFRSKILELEQEVFVNLDEENITDRSIRQIDALKHPLQMMEAPIDNAQLYINHNKPN
ncbi:hypothetical protein SteCoe_32337 [Stentor coeruleus]|uniref:Arrestin-like N-terminal domain-containing protein n=1 Tax=Stentor coeruleus TaxID=5963 RepID=A0A1R2AZ95_9CILI|nr:hypothetical protein SteCoe_32337 [Stentor coeruleus]